MGTQKSLDRFSSSGWGLLSIFIIRPMWLLQLDKVLQSQTVKIPQVDYQLPLQKVLIFRYRYRVLDAWVQEHLDSVKQEFFAENNRTVSDRKIHSSNSISWRISGDREHHSVVNDNIS